jgi:hypothetical protein
VDEIQPGVTSKIGFRRTLDSKRERGRPKDRSNAAAKLPGSQEQAVTRHDIHDINAIYSNTLQWRAPVTKTNASAGKEAETAGFIALRGESGAAQAEYVVWRDGVVSVGQPKKNYCSSEIMHRPVAGQ